MEDLIDATEPVAVDPTEPVLVLVQPLHEVLLFEDEPTVEEQFPFLDDADTEPSFTGVESHGAW
ncbi:MAG: hypothetical protein JWN44_3178 [Myxococcales bacterium]|nr:hypothetical protein [Myxococcales bacterium]